MDCSSRLFYVDWPFQNVAKRQFLRSSSPIDNHHPHWSILLLLISIVRFASFPSDHLHGPRCCLNSTARLLISTWTDVGRYIYIKKEKARSVVGGGGEEGWLGQHGEVASHFLANQSGNAKEQIMRVERRVAAEALQRLGHAAHTMWPPPPRCL